jgi:pimeloyl-ACP methyl ester carboxylesterase
MTAERRYRAAEQQLFSDAGINPTEHRIGLPRIGVTARVLEIGKGTPTVFLHGGPNAAATWSYVTAATSGLRCLLVDRPGCGLSDPPPATPNAKDLPTYVEQLTADLLDGLGLERACLVGSSFGGYSALRSAAAHPDRVDRIVLAGCPAFVPGWTAPSYFTLLRTPWLGRLLLAVPATAASVRLSLKQMGHRRSLATDCIPTAMVDWIRAWQRDTATMGNDAAMIAACGTWRAGFDPSLDLDAHDLATVNAPCAILVGSDDPVGGEHVARHLAALLPTATLDVRSDAGHLPWLDDPAWVAARITNFLSPETEVGSEPRTADPPELT